MTAHYFATKTQKYVVISETFSPVGKRIDVSSTREARQVAKAHNAKPWNF